jgi:hypothetical protein
MKTIMSVTFVAIIICGTVGVLNLRNSLADPGEVARARADAAMTQKYGANWYETYLTCLTNRAQSRAMTAAYETAIGVRPAK